MSKKEELGFETCKVQFSMTGRTGAEHVFNTGERDHVTPPEYKVLERIHGRANIKITALHDELAREAIGEDAKGRPVYRMRSNEEEVERLRSWYGSKMFAAVYDQEYPDLPFTFAEARIHTSTPDNVRSLAKSRSAEDNQKKLENALSASVQQEGSAAAGE